MCEEIEPDVVEIRADGWSYPQPGVWISRERAEHLCAECPSQAIKVVASDPAPGR